MDNNIGTLVEREVVFVKKLIPKEYMEVEKLAPVELIGVNGKFFPIKYENFIKYIPTDFIEVEIPILIPKY